MLPTPFHANRGLDCNSIVNAVIMTWHDQDPCDLYLERLELAVAHTSMKGAHAYGCARYIGASEESDGRTDARCLCGVAIG